MAFLGLDWGDVVDIGAWVAAPMTFGSSLLVKDKVKDAIGVGNPDPNVQQLQRLLAQPTPALPDSSDEAVRNARIFERRKQLGLQGRMSTFLTTAQGDQAPAQPSTPTNTLLGS